MSLLDEWRRLTTPAGVRICLRKTAQPLAMRILRLLQTLNDKSGLTEEDINNEPGWRTHMREHPE